ncbi:MAG: tRNA dimethylallyltransferase [Hyphomicrobium sp.]
MEVREDVRAFWRAEAERRGAEALHTELQARDPVMAARLAPSDAQRIVRALEVQQSTGRSLADWQTRKGEPVLEEADTERFVLHVDRAELHARADARFGRMLEDGALDEVRALEAMQLDPGLPAMRAIGVGPLIRLLRGDIGREEAGDLAKAETRQYIKRQETWLRRHMIAWKPIKTKETESLAREIVAFIRS